MRTDYNRQELIAICERAVVPLADWNDRDTPDSQTKIGMAWALLKAGCPFVVCADPKEVCCTDAETIWIEIKYPRFMQFECGETSESDSKDWPDETFYLPTPERLDKVAGKDWY